MLPLIGAAKVATQLAPLAIGLFHKRPKTPNIQGILARYRASGPSAYLSPEDYAAGERTAGKLTAASARAAEIQRAEQGRQILARRLGGPAAAALADSATATEAAGREAGATAEANQLYQTGTEKMNTLFGAELGAANIAAQRADQRDQTFWNSMVDLAGATSALWQPPATAATTPGMTTTAPKAIPGARPRSGSIGALPHAPLRPAAPSFPQPRYNPAVSF